MTFLTREQQRVLAVAVLLLALGWVVKTWWLDAPAARPAPPAARQ